jgi:hypothetical protein
MRTGFVRADVNERLGVLVSLVRPAGAVSDHVNVHNANEPEEGSAAVQAVVRFGRLHVKRLVKSYGQTDYENVVLDERPYESRRLERPRTHDDIWHEVLHE